MGTAPAEEPKCGNADCGRPIKEKAIVAEGKIFHLSCFKCADCRTPLGTEYNVLNGKVLCKNCLAKMKSAPCAGCGKPIEKQCYEVIGKRFHAECLKCKTCNSTLSFDAIYPFNGETYCMIHCFMAKNQQGLQGAK